MSEKLILILGLAALVPVAIYLFVISRAPLRKWWEDMLIVLGKTSIFTLVVYMFYVYHNLDKVVLGISLLILLAYTSNGFRKAYGKWKRDRPKTVKES